MANRTLPVVLTALTVGLVFGIVWLRAKRHGRDEFWKRVERLTWACALIGAAAAVAGFLRPAESSEVATNPPATTAPVSTPASAPVSPPATTAPSVTPSTTPSAPTSSYVLQPAIPALRIAAPRSSCGRTFVDLDGPAVRVNGDNEPGDELMYWQCSPVGLQGQNAQYFGTAAKTRPATAEQCAQLAKVSAVAGNIEPQDLKLDQSFCLITDQENVVWLRLVKKDQRASGDDPDLVFQIAIWKRT